MSKIATVQTFDAGNEKLMLAWGLAGQPRIVRFEGFDGVGKTSLARLFATGTDGVHVAGDDYVSRPEVERAYRDCVRQSELDQAIEAAFATGRVVILEAVCLDEIAPRQKWGRGFVVYVKRLSFNNWDPVWSEGYNLIDEAPTKEIHRSIHDYHNRMRPHETADLIIEMPELLHSITPGAYSRDRCFDPPGSELI
jgi:hypothetical protein